MKNKFFAIGYHGTSEDFTPAILSGINFTLNKGDKFLGQGFYLWRDSHDRAYKWSQKTKNFNKIDIILVEMECNKKNVLNFASQSWNNEEDLIQMYLNYFKHLSFGEFLDYLIYDKGNNINIVVIIDLTKNITTFSIKDKRSETNFAFGDIQICLKNNKPIKNIEKVA